MVTKKKNRNLAGQIQAEGDEIKTVESAQDINVGKSLRRLRDERGLTIRALASQSGLAVNTLSLIENGKTSPSVSTLQQLASAMDIPITAFFDADRPEQKVIHLSAHSRQRAAFESGFMEDLGTGARGRRIEPFVVTLEPHASSGPLPIVHTGHEFVFCLEGCLTYEIEGQEYILDAGDSLLFEAHLPHRWMNADYRPSRSLLVLCPSDERDRPTERHFTSG
jgi:transcriptional regulator with XRE-family HTH domain